MIERCVNNELRELDSLFGPASVKEQISKLVKQLIDERDYRAKGLTVLSARPHLVFSGPPGVGKSQVARVFGTLCCRLGTLEKGHLVIVGQADLATASRDDKVATMQAKCEEALDGILFVRNDAFLAAGILRSTGDLHLDAVDVMIEFMAQYRGRIIVILDARPNQLQYVSFHSGLARRFGVTVDFPPYDAFELIQTLAVKAKRLGLELPDGVEADLVPWIVASSRRSDWRNSHEMADLFSRALGARALRNRRERRAVFSGFTRDDFKQALLAMQTNGPVDIYSSLPVSAEADDGASPLPTA